MDTSKSGLNLDPLTGGSSYTTSNSTNNAGAAVMKSLFPITTSHILDNYDADKILLKLKEFNIKIGDDLSMPHEKVEGVIKLLSTPANIADLEATRSIKEMYNWPIEYLFPVLDVTRLLVRDAEMCALIGNFELLDICILNLETGTPPANKLMSTRLLSNMITNKWGRGLFEAKFEALIGAVKTLKNGNVAMQNAISTFLFNVSVAQVEIAVEEKCKVLTEATIDFLQWADQLDAELRAMQALGNILSTTYKPASVALIVSAENLIEKLTSYAAGKSIEGYEMVRDTAQAILQMLNE